MLTREEFNELIRAHDNAVMSAMLRKERNRPKADYDEACILAVTTTEDIWNAINR